HSLTLSGVRINACSAEERRKSFDDSVTVGGFLANLLTEAKPCPCARWGRRPEGRERLALGERNLDFDFGAAPGLGADLEGPLLQLGPFAHREQAQVLVLVQVGFGPGDVEALAVILDHH